jgi:hypothetical protein
LNIFINYRTITIITIEMSSVKQAAITTTITFTSAWIGGILYTYYTTRHFKYASEFDMKFFTIEGLRNSFIMGGSIGFISSLLFVR